MNTAHLLLAILSIVLIAESLWILRITKKYISLLDTLSRASAKVVQHKILTTELRQLLEDEEDLDRCLREEVDGKAYERAREVVYEQNKVKYSADNDGIPWTPTVNPK